MNKKQTKYTIIALSVLCALLTASTVYCYLLYHDPYCQLMKETNEMIMESLKEYNEDLGIY